MVTSACAWVNGGLWCYRKDEIRGRVCAVVPVSSGGSSQRILGVGTAFAYLLIYHLLLQRRQKIAAEGKC